MVKDIKRKDKNPVKESASTSQILEVIIQGITESIILLSTDFRILWANQAAVMQTGVPMEKLVGSYCYQATHQLDHPCKAPDDPCPVFDVIKTGKVQVREHMHYAADGRKVFVEVSAYPITNESGEIISFVHISRDITNRKEYETERERLISELQKSIAEIKTLSGMLPICASCKKIRDDKGYWTQIESYISEHSETQFTHGICPECLDKLYPRYSPKK
ncbi:MAG: PAS domain-containing protein [Candidatus Riflebacteria bacterium]|nr:PAS domain-containing protein [Candidatus Riflebacteria bacterium]